jgi:CheY-like chemotaxis protein
VDRRGNGDVVRFVPGTSGARSAGIGVEAVPKEENMLLSIDRIMVSASFDGPGVPADVLIVEDDPIIAIDFEDRLLGFGVKSVRTVASVARALHAITDRVPDYALLDVELVHEKSFAIAERLVALKIPFVFVTGYGAETRIPPEFANVPRLQKPCSSEALEAALRVRASR